MMAALVLWAMEVLVMQAVSALAQRAWVKVVVWATLWPEVKALVGHQALLSSVPRQSMDSGSQPGKDFSHGFSRAYHAAYEVWRC